MKCLVAIDSFKGCLTSVEANAAAAAGIRTKMPAVEVVQVAVSDGGEGWLEAFRRAIGGEEVEIVVRDPLMRPVKARYLVSDDKAIIEMAQASGLTLLAPEERNPLLATSYGTGQLVADAVHRGCRHIIVGLGGSATSDCGIGMLHALIDSFATRGHWDNIREFDDISFTIATDVDNPLFGENGAAHVFAPQKGATPDMVQRLEERARLFAESSARHFGFDRSNVPGAGAAGGLGYAFLQYLGGHNQGNVRCRRGIDLFLDAVDFDRLLSDVALVVTGEGSADRQTLMGKVPYGILKRAKAQGINVCLLAGRIADRQALLDAGFAQVACINPEGLPLVEALKPDVAKANIAAAAMAAIHKS